MPKQDQNNKKTGSSREQRKIRTQQIFFGILAAIIIISWLIALVAH